MLNNKIVLFFFGMIVGGLIVAFICSRRPVANWLRNRSIKRGSKLKREIFFKGSGKLIKLFNNIETEILLGGKKLHEPYD